MCHFVGLALAVTTKAKFQTVALPRKFITWSEKGTTYYHGSLRKSLEEDWCRPVQTPRKVVSIVHRLLFKISRDSFHDQYH